MGSTYRIIIEKIRNQILWIRADFLQSHHIDVAELPLTGIRADVEQFVELQFVGRCAAHIPCRDVYTENRRRIVIEASPGEGIRV